MMKFESVEVWVYVVSMTYNCALSVIFEVQKLNRW